MNKEFPSQEPTDRDKLFVEHDGDIVEVNPQAAEDGEQVMSYAEALANLGINPSDVQGEEPDTAAESRQNQNPDKFLKRAQRIDAKISDTKVPTLSTLKQAARIARGIKQTGEDESATYTDTEGNSVDSDLAERLQVKADTSRWILDGETRQAYETIAQITSRDQLNSEHKELYPRYKDFKDRLRNQGLLQENQTDAFDQYKNYVTKSIELSDQLQNQATDVAEQSTPEQPLAPRPDEKPVNKAAKPESKGPRKDVAQEYLNKFDGESTGEKLANLKATYENHRQSPSEDTTQDTNIDGQLVRVSDRIEINRVYEGENKTGKVVRKDYYWKNAKGEREGEPLEGEAAEAARAIKSWTWEIRQARQKKIEAAVAPSTDNEATDNPEAKAPTSAAETKPETPSVTVEAKTSTPEQSAGQALQSFLETLDKAVTSLPEQEAQSLKNELNNILDARLKDLSNKNNAQDKSTESKAPDEVAEAETPDVNESSLSPERAAELEKVTKAAQRLKGISEKRYAENSKGKPWVDPEALLAKWKEEDAVSDENSSEEAHEKESFAHGVDVQYEASPDGSIAVGQEYTEPGDVMDWSKHPQTNGSETSTRQILLTSEDGKRIFIMGNDIYYLGKSDAEKATKTRTLGSDEEIENVVIGEEQEGSKGKFKYTKVEIGSTEGDKPESPEEAERLGEKRGKNPFDAAYDKLVKDGLLDSEGNPIDSSDEGKMLQHGGAPLPSFEELRQRANGNHAVGPEESNESTETSAKFWSRKQIGARVKGAMAWAREKLGRRRDNAHTGVIRATNKVGEYSKAVREYYNPEDKETKKDRMVIAGIVLGVAAVGAAYLETRGLGVSHHASEAKSSGAGAVPPILAPEHHQTGNAIPPILAPEHHQTGVGAGAMRHTVEVKPQAPVQETLQAYSPQTGYDTGWHEVHQYAGHLGHQDLNNAQIERLTDATLKINGLTWDDARKLPVGYRMDMLSPERINEILGSS